MSKETIIFLSANDPHSTNDWSGIPYFMFKALQENYQIVYIQSPKLRRLKLMGYYINRVLSAAGVGKVLFDFGFLVAFFSGLTNTRSIKKIKTAKFIFCPGGVVEVAFLKTKIPLVICTDCSLLQLIGYYPALERVLDFSAGIVNRIERRAYAKASVSIFSSSWAGDFISKTYSTKSISIVPFGANLSTSYNEQHVQEKSTCTLIFVGVDWKRKGGDLAVQIRRELERSGIDCRLIVVGVAPADVSESKVEIVRNLDKRLDEEKYASLFRAADFLVLPTIADCTPVVIAESFAFGVPVLAADTGGISQMIQDGKNGFLIRDRSALTYAAIASEVLQNFEKRQRMAAACVDSYRTTFNWRTWASGVEQAVATLN